MDIIFGWLDSQQSNRWVFWRPTSFAHIKKNETASLFFSSSLYIQRSTMVFGIRGINSSLFLVRTALKERYKQIKLIIHVIIITPLKSIKIISSVKSKVRWLYVDVVVVVVFVYVIFVAIVFATFSHVPACVSLTFFRLMFVPITMRVSFDLSLYLRLF